MTGGSRKVCTETDLRVSRVWVTFDNPKSGCHGHRGRFAEGERELKGETEENVHIELEFH